MVFWGIFFDFLTEGCKFLVKLWVHKKLKNRKMMNCRKNLKKAQIFHIFTPSPPLSELENFQF